MMLERLSGEQIDGRSAESAAAHIDKVLSTIEPKLAAKGFGRPVKPGMSVQSALITNYTVISDPFMLQGYVLLRKLLLETDVQKRPSAKDALEDDV